MWHSAHHQNLGPSIHPCLCSPHMFNNMVLFVPLFMWCVIGRILRWPHDFYFPLSPTLFLWFYHIPLFANVIKFTNHLNLRQIHYLGGPNLFSWSHTEEEFPPVGDRRRSQRDLRWKGSDVREGAKEQGSESDLWKLRGIPADSQQVNGDFGPTTAKNWILTITDMDLEEDPELQMRTQLINTFISVLWELEQRASHDISDFWPTELGDNT